MSETQAQRIKRLRKAKGWTQEALAQQAGCSQGAVGNLEGTKQRSYSLETITQIAKALQTTVDYLELRDGVVNEPHGQHSFLATQLALMFDDLPNERILRNRAYLAVT